MAEFNLFDKTICIFKLSAPSLLNDSDFINVLTETNDGLVVLINFQPSSIFITFPNFYNQTMLSFLAAVHELLDLAVGQFADSVNLIFAP